MLAAVDPCTYSTASLTKTGAPTLLPMPTPFTAEPLEAVLVAPALDVLEAVLVDVALLVLRYIVAFTVTSF